MKKKWMIYLAAIVLILIILKVSFYYSVLTIPDVKVNYDSSFVETNSFRTGNFTSVEMLLPAVDKNGNGTMTRLRVEATPGSGRTLVDIDNLLFFEDTQQSIRVARLVAQDETGIDLSKYDLSYFIEANASVIGGPSAGVAIAIATIASIEGKKIKEDVMMTGAINRDGSIGPVNSVLEKAKVSKKYEANVFLVPLMQSRDVVYETSKSCDNFGGNEFCSDETKPRKISLSEEVGLKFVEIEDIREAESYAFE